MGGYHGHQLGPLRPCACGCGRQVPNSHYRYLPECRKRRRHEQYKSAPGRMSQTGKRVFGEAMREKRKICFVCFDLSERRERVCKGCGKAHAPERIRP